MLTAFIYREVKDQNIDVKQYKLFNYLWKLTIPFILFGAFGAPYLFSSFNFEKPAFWISFYGAFHRSMWGLCLGVIILGYSSGMGGQWKAFFNASIFKPLGKINFGFYLTHLTMIKFILGDMHYPHFLNNKKFVSAFFINQALQTLFYGEFLIDLAYDQRHIHFVYFGSNRAYTGGTTGS